MVDTYGRWTPEANYSTYPKEKWCDMGYAYQIILDSGYKVQQTDSERFVEFLLAEFDESEDYEPKADENLMVNVDMFRTFIEESGGLKEFDYEC